jgi:hypothetical protein
MVGDFNSVFELPSKNLTSAWFDLNSPVHLKLQKFLLCVVLLQFLQEYSDLLGRLGDKVLVEMAAQDREQNLRFLSSDSGMRKTLGHPEQVASTKVRNFLPRPPLPEHERLQYFLVLGMGSLQKAQRLSVI